MFWKSEFHPSLCLSIEPNICSCKTNLNPLCTPLWFWKKLSMKWQFQLSFDGEYLFFYAFPIRKIISLVENKVTNIFRSPTHALEVFVVQLKMTIQQHLCSTVQLNVTLQSWIGTTSMFYNFCTEYTRMHN